MQLVLDIYIGGKFLENGTKWYPHNYLEQQYLGSWLRMPFSEYYELEEEE